MSKVLVGFFMTVFVGALIYEILNRTKPEFTEKIEKKFSEGLDNVLTPAGAKA